MANALTPRQRQYLKAAAHHLKPIIHIGKGGVTDPLLAELDAALLAQELVKIKVHNNSPVHPDNAEAAGDDDDDDNDGDGDEIADAEAAPSAGARARAARDTLATTLCARLPGTQHVGTIGHTLVLFRQNINVKDRPTRFQLPKPPRPQKGRTPEKGVMRQRHWWRSSGGPG